MLQEFDISITAVGNDRYLVRTEQVAPGVPLAQEQFHWPIDQWLEEASTLMHDPLLGILKGEPSQRWASTPKYRSGNDDNTPAAPLPTLVSLGQALYNSLFDRALRDSWLTAQGVAQNRRSPLRLRLGLKGEKLQQLPWEVLHAGDRPLGTGTDVTFSRYHLGRRQGYDRPVATVPDFEQPLRVLMVIATPTDQDRLELTNEVEQLQNELHPPSMRSGRGYNILPKQQLDVQLTVLKQPGRAELTQALEQGNYQALHYAGHSNLGNAGGDLYLVSRQTGLTERISGEDLAGLLSNNGVKLAVLNSCRGAYAHSSGAEMGWHEQNLAQALVNRGIPGVIAMAERIPDNVAITFTQLLYRNLKQGNPIDLSLNRTRQGLISAHGSHYSYWALPILYMQPGFDGYLASKPGTDNSALDKLLSESESALKALEQPAALSEVSDAPGPDSTAVGKIDSKIDSDQVDLDNLVETVELDEFLRYDDDSDDSTVPELVEKLSQPSASDQVMLADVDESLIPETLETPGLDLYEQLPKKPEPQSEPDDGKTIYNDARSHLPEQAEPAANTNQKSGSSRRRQRRVALGLGAAALLGIIGVGISDPFGWVPAPVSPPQPTPATDSSPSNVQSVSQVIAGDPESIVEVLTEKADTEGLSAALKLTDALYAERTAESAPTLFFSKGQLQWAMIKTNDPALGVKPADAATSWEDALTANPDWLDAQVALGFARYEQDLMANAIALWEDAIRNETEQSVPTVTFDADDRRWPMQLHAYLGLAIAHHQNANLNVDNAEKANSLAIARDYWQSAIDLAGDGNELINPEELGDHWLWSEKALIDWRNARKGLAASISSD